MPPTVCFYLDNGLLLARGSKEQLALINREVLNLNGVSAADAEAASKNFTPFEEVPHPTVETTQTNLFTRTFKLDTRTFIHNLNQIKGVGEVDFNETTNTSRAVSAVARKFFTALGVNLEFIRK